MVYTTDNINFYQFPLILAEYKKDFKIKYNLVREESKVVLPSKSHDLYFIGKQ